MTTSNPPARSRRWITALLGTPLALGLAYLAGPRVRVDTTVDPIELPPDLDRHLAESEARFPDLIPGTEKTIVWAHPDRRVTPRSVIYVHGFSATRQETRPLADRVAEALGANLFYTRLTGHGRSPAAMAEGSVRAWVNDLAEAIAIGRRLGDRVILIGTSTGGSLAVWYASQQPQGLGALVAISPNFHPRDRASRILLWPWARHLVRVVVGEERSWEGENQAHERYWTNRYPSGALLPMMAVTRLARRSRLEKLTVPTLFVYSTQDQVVDPAATEAAFERLGAPVRRLHPFEGSDDPRHHVLAGDALSPTSTEPVAAEIVGFLREL